MRDGLGVLDAWVCCVGDVYGSQAPGPLVCVGNLWDQGVLVGFVMILWVSNAWVLCAQRGSMRLELRGPL